ncbi:MAG: FMN-binding negative transcriptional regulator, partial [Pseudomonadota bacterium]
MQPAHPPAPAGSTRSKPRTRRGRCSIPPCPFSPPPSPSRYRPPQDQAMHPNPAFRSQETAEALIEARARGFGILTAQGPDGPLASHVPFLLDGE